MELTVKDLYKVEKVDNLSEAQLNALFLVYQPIIGFKAVTLYLTLYADKTLVFENHDRLSILLNMSMMEINEARKKLEEVILIKTYVNDKKQFLYKLQPPLNCNNFLKNEIFAKLLYQSIGSEQFQLTLKRYLVIDNNKDFKEVSIKLKNDVNIYNTNVIYNKPKAIDYVQISEEYGFNVEELVRKISPLVFPFATRTQENLKVIASIANLCGLSIDDMTVIIGRCSDYENDTLDLGLLKKLALTYKAKPIKVEDKYDLPPLLFLKKLQHGIDVTQVDARLIEYLSSKLLMKNAVINVLVEYVLKLNDNRLPRNFVEKIAGEWVRSKVDTKEKALDKIKNEHLPKIKTLTLPDYQSEVTEDDSLSITSEEIENLKKRIKGIS